MMLLFIRVLLWGASDAPDSIELVPAKSTHTCRASSSRFYLSASQSQHSARFGSSAARAPSLTGEINMKKSAYWAVSTLLAASAQGQPDPGTQQETVRWLAGDHHIHSRYSVSFDEAAEAGVELPGFTVGGDARYPIPMNAAMARRYGLDWMASTDHGGPGHSRINLELAYPELQQSRMAIPELIQFYAMEFDTPGADHSSLIVPYSADEAEHLREIESRFSKREPWPADPSWDTEPRMLDALRAMRELPQRPIVIAHHPSRSAPGLGEYGQTAPAELRGWNDVAPDIAIGMEGSPGHQAAWQRQPVPGAGDDVTDTEERPRGSYGNYPTLGGYDQMTARLGGFWDSMLGEGRRWWITANSDSHVHWTEGGSDFWPGEYSKTYVLARKNHESILDAMRQGQVFVTTGDLVSELWVSVRAPGKEVMTGEVLALEGATEVTVEIRFVDPEQSNFNGDTPEVSRVDLIIGEITGRQDEPSLDSHPSARVEARFGPEQWRRDGRYQVIEHTLALPAGHSFYLRVRGTNTDEAEPLPDALGEDPWQDLWFYSNPIFMTAGAQ
jgi:hypothetical protein